MTTTSKTRLTRLLALSLIAGLPACKDQDERRGEESVRIDVPRHRVPVFDDDRARGGEQPLVTIVMFTDYACAPCRTSWTTMNNLLEDYGDDLRVVWRGYTVPGFTHGELAAEAVLAAGNQGKFWEMHARLFENPTGFDRPVLRAHAEAIGLDVARFLDDLDTGSQAGTLIRHRREATRLGIRGLPSAFVNGLYVVGAKDEAGWHALLDEEVRRVREMMQQGTPRAEVYETVMAKAADRPVGEVPQAAALRAELDQRQQEASGRQSITAPDASKRYAITPGDAPSRGPADALVVVVEFLDFECPFCRKAWTEEVSGLVEAFPGDVRVAVRHLPLEIHPTAESVSRASLAAHRQGKFWPFHERMIGFKGRIGREALLEVAREVGLDVVQFEKDLDDPKIIAQVDEDIRIAHRVGLTGTPSFFVNGRPVRGFQPGTLRGVVREELAVAKAHVEQGIPRDKVFEHIMKDAVPESQFPNP